MLNALCAVALAATCSLDSHLARVEASTGASAALAVAASPTSFEAHNFGLVPQVLQFRCGAAAQIRVLGPGASLRYAFPRQQLAGVVLEVHALEAGRFASRASIDLQRLSRGGAEAAWILEGSNDAWLQYGDAIHAHDASVGEPKHVPVPPPQPRPVEQRPVRPTTRPRPF